MTLLYRTVITTIGPDVADLAEGGVVILFAEGAPPELAEVAVLHRAEGEVGAAPRPGDVLRIGGREFSITAIGETAWKMVADMGHVVFNFSGVVSPDRPGEICLEATEGADVLPLLVPGAAIEILARA
jgi:PTS system glucitol/sorbitol-specific IIA component